MATQQFERTSFSFKSRPVNPLIVTPGSTLASTLVLVLMSPSPVQSMISRIFGLPSVVTERPVAPGSTPVSNTATTMLRPSASGRVFRNSNYS